MSEADVKLLSNAVVVEGTDLMLDAGPVVPDRRKNDSSWRRALVHDNEDMLTINYANDYPGGVTINHLKTIDPRAKLEGRLTAAESTVTIKGGVKIEGSLEIDYGISGKVYLKWHKPDAAGLGVGLAYAGLEEKKEQTVPIPLDEILSYILCRVATMQANMQDGWRWCKNCGALHHKGQKSVCPAAPVAGGPHSEEGSGKYLVPYS